MVNMTEPLATALHSWANQCVDCACGCRGPLSCNRLQAQGLFGVLAHVPGRSPDKNVRHLSAREMALLTGFPKTEGWTDHQRLLCAGVGQLASPLQSAWVFTSILNHLIEHGFFMVTSRLHNKFWHVLQPRFSNSETRGIKTIARLPWNYFRNQLKSSLNQLFPTHRNPKRCRT